MFPLSKIRTSCAIVTTLIETPIKAINRMFLEKDRFEFQVKSILVEPIGIFGLSGF